MASQSPFCCSNLAVGRPRPRSPQSPSWHNITRCGYSRAPGRTAMNSASNEGRLALLVGGGPAPGINGVISAVTIEARNHGTEVLGIQDGFQWLMKSDGKPHW